MFIRTLNIREIGVIERLLLSFFLPGFAGDVLNSYALSCVYHHALGQGPVKIYAQIYLQTPAE